MRNPYSLLLEDFNFHHVNPETLALITFFVVVLGTVVGVEPVLVFTIFVGIGVFVGFGVLVGVGAGVFVGVGGI